MDRAASKLVGEVFFITDNKQSIAAEQIALLSAIQTTGSINKAAKLVGISYRTAWDRVETMNNLSHSPLVIRHAGGAHGGGTTLTESGCQVVAGFTQLQLEHQRFIEQLGKNISSFSDVAHFMRAQHMKTSARNQFRGNITDIFPGSVNVEVHLDIGAQQPLIAMVTKDSVDTLGLKKGQSVIALIKASSVIIASDAQIATSARNKLTGHISRLLPGAVNTDIVIELAQGKSISAIISNASVEALKLGVNQSATAIFKASSVILLND